MAPNVRSLKKSNALVSLSKILLTLLLLLSGYSIHSSSVTQPVQALSTGVVISQVYGGGGNTGAQYTHDFIEVFNRGTMAVSLNGWSIQYAAAAGSTWQVTPLSNVSLQPGKYYLIQESGDGTTNLPTPDVSGNIEIAATSGKVALVSSTTPLSGACPSGGNIIDLVGYGSANCSETSPAPTLSNTTAAIRVSGGCKETDNNSADFTEVAPSPRNSGTPATTCAVTQIRMNDFSAEQRGRQTNLKWETGLETDNLGFHVYREDDGRLSRVTPDMIAGSALFAGANTVLSAGRSYSWRDPKPASKDTRYWLESIDLDGKTEMHGPYFVNPEPIYSSGVSGESRDSMLLDELNTVMPAPTHTTTVAPSALLPQAATNPWQPPVAAPNSVKLFVKHSGMHSITMGELVGAGLPPTVDTRHLQLFLDGVEQPIIVTGDKNGRFINTDKIEFYGVGVDSPYSSTRTYYLVAGSKKGLRIGEAKGHAKNPAASSFLQAVERRDRTIYFSALRNGERENFFGAVVAANPVNQTLTLNNVADLPGATAALEIAMQGVTNIFHTHRVLLNGSEIGQVWTEAQLSSYTRLEFPHSLLQEGANTVTLVTLGGSSDVSLVDYLRLHYHRRYRAQDETIRFTANGNESVTVGGFTGKAVRVFDVTEPGKVREVKGIIDQDGATYTVTVDVPEDKNNTETTTRTLIALVEGKQLKPAVSFNIPSDLRNPYQGADYLIITRRAFFDALKPLAALRGNQGLSVAFIDVEDIYDEFSFGQKTPYAVKSFLNFTQNGWRTRPRFVLFAGDATYDPKNYLGLGDNDIVPTKLIDTYQLETASDDWLADFDGDTVADLSVGRVPAKTVAEVTAFVNKLIAYENGTPGNLALLVSDYNDGYNFEGAISQLNDLLPDSINGEMILRSQAGDASARSRLFDGLNRGAKLVNYAGHGSVGLWRGSILTTTDARNLTNSSSLPVFLMMTCLNGYFHDASADSLAEALLKNGNGGAIAVWASSSLTFAHPQSLMNQELYRTLFNTGAATSPPMTLGEAVRQARIYSHDEDVKKTWILFGDPAMRLR